MILMIPYYLEGPLKDIPESPGVVEDRNQVRRRGIKTYGFRG